MPPRLNTWASITFHPNLAASPDSKLVAAPTMDGRIFVFDVALGSSRGELVGHRGEAREVAFIDDKTLASVGADQTLRIWDLAREEATVIALAAIPTSVAASPADGTLVVGAKDGKLRLPMVWTPDGRHIVRMTDEHVMSFSDMTERKADEYVGPHRTNLFGLKETPKRAALEERVLAAIGTTLLPQRDAKTRVALSPDQKLTAT